MNENAVINYLMKKKDVRVDSQVIRQFLFSHDLLKKTAEINSSQA